MTTNLPFSLLKPAAAGQYGPRDDWRIATAGDWFNVESVVRRISGPVIVDFETTGLNFLAPDFRTVGIGLSGKGLEGGIYFSLKNGEDPTTLIKALCKRELVAHNVTYDAGVLERMIRDHDLPSTLSARWPWKWDTISMYFHLSQHEWPQQRYGLKAAQVEVLGWEDKGDVKLDAWLSERGLRKGDMWRAPDEILGEYGCYDVQSTYQLFEHLLPQLEQFPDAVQFISEVEVPYHYRAIVEMRFAGMKMDVPRLSKLQESLQTEVDAFRSQFMNHEQVKPWIDTINIDKELELLDKEPDKLTGTGKPSVRYANWLDKWKSRHEDAGEWVNTNSKKQLRDLFFNHLYRHGPVEPIIGYDGSQRAFKNGKLMWEVDLFVDGKKIAHEWASKTSDVPVDKEVLGKLGEVGEMLLDYNKKNKLLGYVKGMAESLVDGIHHGQLRPLGTMTGRAAGSGGINLQQIPKDPEYLECFVAREGHTLIDADVTALEPCVLAELSECPNYMKLYGPEAKPNDIYLFVGANTQALGETLRKYGYNPDNPTPDTIKLTKKNLKKERSIAKVLHLSSGYGAGANKIWKTLLGQGIELSLDDAKQIHKDYWHLFRRIKDYEQELLGERENNGGYIIDGIGMPVTIGKFKKKDILNSLIQGTGHRVLVRHIANVMKLRDKSGLDFKFWIADIHDQTTIETPTHLTQAVLELFREAEDLTNAGLGGIINLKIEPEAAQNFAPFKL